MKHSPLSIEEIKKQRAPVKNINIEHVGKMTALEKAALYITQKIITISFFFALLAWTIIWLIWNTLMPDSFHFDPFPAFVLCVFFFVGFYLKCSPAFPFTASDDRPKLARKARRSKGGK